MGNGQFHRGLVIIALAIFTTAPAFAGPPYVTDDPEPTETGHFEIYAFAAGTQTQDGNSGAGGIDFNYGAAPDVQLTVTAPIAFDNPHKARTRSGFGNLELAVKYRFLHQADVGWDVAVFPACSCKAARAMSVNIMPRCWCRSGWGAIGVIGPLLAAVAAPLTIAVHQRIIVRQGGHSPARLRRISILVQKSITRPRTAKAAQQAPRWGSAWSMISTKLIMSWPRLGRAFIIPV